MCGLEVPSAYTYRFLALENLRITCNTTRPVLMRRNTPIASACDEPCSESPFTDRISSPWRERRKTAFHVRCRGSRWEHRDIIFFAILRTRGHGHESEMRCGVWKMKGNPSLLTGRGLVVCSIYINGLSWEEIGRPPTLRSICNVGLT